MPELLLRVIPIGIGATLVMDAWALVRRAWFETALPNYSLVGRWIAWMPRGRFVHQPISATPPRRGEALIGWAAHYGVGIVFAAVLLAIAGPDWPRAPTLMPALFVGVASVAAPFFLMQPGLGLGLAARRAPAPGRARVQSLVTHAVFGVGLYLAAWIASRLMDSGNS